MAKLASDYLFSLVKSMSKAEKRHFKVYSSKRVLGDANIYFHLFDAIENQKEYDEEKIKAYPVFKDLPTLKKRLYKALLASLADYHSTIGIGTRNAITYVEILFNKSLFGHCLRHIRKIKGIMEENELYEEWLEILRWEYKIVVRKSLPRMGVLEEENKVYELLGNRKKYRDLVNVFLEKYQRFGFQRNARDMRSMKRIVNSEFMQNEDLALSFTAKQHFYDCNSLYAVITGDHKSSYRFSKKAIDLYLANPAITANNAFSFMLRINNFLLTCLDVKKYDKIPDYIDLLEKGRIKLQSASDRATAFFYLYNLLNYYIYTGLFDESVEDLKRIEQELSEHENNLSQIQKITLYAVIAQVYFGLKNYKGSLRWLNKILAFGEINIRHDLECFIRVFYLIVHYEANSDKDLMASMLKSANRFLNKHEHMYKFETCILDFFKEHMRKGSKKQNMKQSFVSLKRQVEQLAKDPYEKQALNYFDFISYLESKIEDIPLAEVMRRKSGKKI